MTSYLKKEKDFTKPTDDAYTCHKKRTNNNTNPDAMFQFAPAFTGPVLFGQKLEIEGNCFESISMEMNYLESDKS